MSKSKDKKEKISLWMMPASGESIEIDNVGKDLVIKFKGFDKRIEDVDVAKRFAAFMRSFADVKPEDMLKKDDGAKMLAAHLNGDGLAALTYADEVIAQASLEAGQTFVPRHELVRANGTLAATVGKLRKELRHIRVVLTLPNRQTYIDGEAQEAHFRHRAIADLISRINDALDASAKCDPL